MRKRLAWLKSTLKYAFIPGFILSVAGIVAGVLSKTWTPLYVGLLSVGTVILVTWLIYIFVSAQGFWQRRSTQVGTNAIVATVSLIFILGLINFLTFRYTTPIDLTENQLFTLSPQSQEIVRQLDQPTRVVIFARELSSINEALLKNYQRQNQNFSFELIDPEINPGIARQFNVKSLGEVYLEYGDKQQLVQNLADFSQNQSLSEAKLTNAIETIQRDRTQTIYFLQGQGERILEPGQQSFSEAVNSLKDKGYQVLPLNLAQSKAIPSDADVIVIAGPSRQFFPQAVEALKAYSASGGNLLLLIDPETQPGLTPLLDDWGIELDERIIIDASGSGRLSGLGPTTPIILDHGQHPISEDFSNAISIHPNSRPITTTSKDNIEAIPFLVGSEQMWAESNLDASEVRFDQDQDLPGPFDLGVALSRTISDQEAIKSESSSSDAAADNPSEVPSPSPQASPLPNDNQSEISTESRLVIIGNSTFALNGLFSDPSLLNGDIFLNSVQWLANSDEQPLSIRPKEAANRRIQLTPLQAGALSWLMLLIVPLLGLILAGMSWWRRR